MHDREGIRINECIEWRLLTRLHNQMRFHLLAVTVNIDLDEEKPRKTSLVMIAESNRRQSLNFEMRKALTRQDLEVLIHLDAELSNDSANVLGKAKSRLQDLCGCLEGMVNSPIIQSHRRQQRDPPNPYPNLESLLTHLERLRSKGPTYELLSTTPSKRTLFAYIPIQAPGHVDSLENLKVPFKQFNQFIDDLQVSPASLNDLLVPLSAELKPFSDLGFTTVFNNRFHQHTVTALQTIFSSFTKCDPQEKMKHKVLLGLPCWKELFFAGSRSAPVILNFLCTFCESCSSTNWQEIQILAPSGVEFHSPISICEAAEIPANSWAKLDLHIHEDDQVHTGGPIELMVPPYKSNPSNYNDKNNEKQLDKLIASGAFKRKGRQEDPEIPPEIPSCPLFTYEDTKALAIKLVIGVLFSLESRHAIKTWDSQNIHFFIAPYGSGEEMRHFPFASCDVVNSNDQELLILPRPDIVLTEDIPPSPVFTMLAKILLEIAVGKCGDIQLIESGAVVDAGWEMLSGLIHYYTNAYNVDLVLFPIIIAAYHCLHFHELYAEAALRLYSKLGQDIDAFTIARTVVFEKIIINLQSGMLPRNGCGTVQAAATVDSPKDDKGTEGHKEELHEVARPPSPKQSDTSKYLQEIALFDDPEEVSSDSKSKEALSAKSFFKSLQQFHATCELDLPFEGSERIRIAIIDTGINLDHPGIDAYYTNERLDPSSHNPFNITRCRSWVGSDFHDGIGHGTECALLAAKAAPHAEIYVAKVFNGSKFKPYEAENIAKAIDWAAQQWKVHIISMSFGMHPPTNEEGMAKWLEIRKDIDEAIQRSGRQIIFAAASNSGSNKPRAYPAKSPYVICMHASDGKGKNSTGLNPPPEDESLNLMTLGAGIELLVKRDGAYKFAYKSGTSFATAIASGLAANILILAYRRGGTSSDLLTKLKECEGMRSMFKRMSRKEDGFRYVAPWILWPVHWKSQRVNVWDEIEDKLDGLS